MRVTRIYAENGGDSAFEKVEIELRADSIGRASDIFPATGVFIRELRAGLVNDFHQAPRRQFVFVLNGVIELESSRGVVERVEGGEAIFVEDTTGKGHITRSIGGAVPCIYVAVPDSFAIAQLRKRALKV
jgi:hypothetical protein